MSVYLLVIKYDGDQKKEHHGYKDQDVRAYVGISTKEEVRRNAREQATEPGEHGLANLIEREDDGSSQG